MESGERQGMAVCENGACTTGTYPSQRLACWTGQPSGWPSPRVSAGVVLPSCWGLCNALRGRTDSCCHRQWFSSPRKCNCECCLLASGVRGSWQLRMDPGHVPLSPSWLESGQRPLHQLSLSVSTAHGRLTGEASVCCQPHQTATAAHLPAPFTQGVRTSLAASQLLQCALTSP